MSSSKRLLVVCALLLGVSLQAQSVGRIGKAFGQSAAASESVLSISNITLDGAFQIPPATGAGEDLVFGYGFTGRYVSGALKFYMLSTNRHLIQWADPGVGTPQASYPQVSTGSLTDYGNAYSSAAIDAFGSHAGTSLWLTTGLMWSAASNAFFVTMGDPYGATSGTGDNPSIMCVTVDDVAHTTTGTGIYALSGVQYKGRLHGVIALPAGWSTLLGINSTYTLAAGFGGYESIVASFGTSFGPALHAFAPPCGDTTGTLEPQTTLVHYPYVSDGSESNTRPAGAAAISQTYDTAPNSVETWGDQHPTGICIDTGVHRGCIVFSTLVNGNVQYISSNLSGEGAENWWLFYDPLDLARVAAGSVSPWSISPSSAYHDTSEAEIDFTHFPAAPLDYTNSGITSSGTTATATLPSHGEGVAGTQFRLFVSGATQANYNGGFFATVVDANTVSYTMAGTATSPATGTIRVHHLSTSTGGVFPNLQPMGAWYDTTTKKLYLFFIPLKQPYTTSQPTVYRFSVV